jgi:hypothetical protein
VEAGRAIELDAIVGAVHEIGQRVGVDMPHIGALLGLTRLFAQGRGLSPRCYQSEAAHGDAAVPLPDATKLRK